MRCGDPRWKDQNFGFLEMSNFDIYVVESAFGSILVDPKFGSFHVGSPHLMAVTGQSWLTLVGNSNNEVCSPSNNTVSKAFWQKKVLPEQRISYCEGIYLERNINFCILIDGFFKVWIKSSQSFSACFIFMIIRLWLYVTFKEENISLSDPLNWLGPYFSHILSLLLSWEHFLPRSRDDVSKSERIFFE